MTWRASWCWQCRRRSPCRTICFRCRIAQIPSSNPSIDNHVLRYPTIPPMPTETRKENPTHILVTLLAEPPAIFWTLNEASSVLSSLRRVSRSCLFLLISVHACFPRRPRVPSTSNSHHVLPRRIHALSASTPHPPHAHQTISPLPFHIVVDEFQTYLDCSSNARILLDEDDIFQARV